MKKAFLLLLSAVVSLNAGAQVFNHLSLGAGTGLDGTSVELAVPLGGHVQLRAGYGFAFGLGYTLSGDQSVSVPEHPALDDSPNVNIPIKLALARNDARLLFNIYPSKRSVFHFTFGAYLGGGSFFQGVLKGLPDDYNSIGMEMEDYTVRAIDNEIQMDLRAFGFGSSAFALKPYAGLGFGRPVREDKRVTFSFDLGAIYQGEPSCWARSVKTDGSIAYVDLSGNSDISEVIDEYGQYVHFWPVINFHLYVRLF